MTAFCNYPSSIIHHPVLPRPPLHILPPQNPARHGDARKACGERRRDILRLYATDDHAWTSARRRQQHRGPIAPEGQAGIILGAGAVQRPDAPIVGGETALDFGVTAHRRTQEESRGDDSPGPGWREVVGAEMDARRAGGDGDVEPVVDEDRDRQERHEVSGEREQVAIGGVLEPELNGGDAPRDGGARHGDRVARAQQGVVGHEQETEGGG